MNVLHDSRRDGGQHDRVPDVERQLGHALVIDHHAAVHFLGVEQQRFAGHGYRLGHRADFEPYVHRRGLVHVQLDAVTHEILEAGDLAGEPTSPVESATVPLMLPRAS